MSEVRKDRFLKELRQNKEYMYFVHTAMLTSKFTWFVAALCVLFTVAEYHTGGAFSGFMIAILMYLLNYLAVLYTASPAFAMKGHILKKIDHDEYVDYVVQNSHIIKIVTSEKDSYNVGDEVYLYRFRPCFYFSQDKTGMAFAGKEAA